MTARLPRLLFALAAVVASLAFVLDSLPDAEADGLGPIVTGGAVPWVNLTGDLSTGSGATIYTVPSGRKLIVTGGAGCYTCRLYSGTSTAGALRAHNKWFDVDGMKDHGTGQIVFGPGESLYLHNSSSSYSQGWYLEGYLARP